MDALFFFMLLFSFGAGLLILALLLFIKDRVRDPGLGSFFFPLIPLTLISMLEILRYYLTFRLPGRFETLFFMGLEGGRIVIAFGWNYLAHRHYALNRVDKMRRKRLAFLAVLTALLLLLLPLAVYRIPRLLWGIQLTEIVMLYYAGLKGVLILTKGRKLFSSSRAAVFVAAASLICYPLIAAGDILGWQLPFLEPGPSFWVQAHPLYVIVVNVPLLYFLIRLSGRPGPEAVTAAQQGADAGKGIGKAAAGLSPREREVLQLLYAGYSYREMAEALFVSLATVKSHVHHIYQKLDISRREDLYRRFGGVMPSEPPAAE